jgi:hypothetical protein
MYKDVEAGDPPRVTYTPVTPRKKPHAHMDREVHAAVRERVGSKCFRQVGGHSRPASYAQRLGCEQLAAAYTSRPFAVRRCASLMWWSAGHTASATNFRSSERRARRALPTRSAAHAVSPSGSPCGLMRSLAVRARAWCIWQNDELVPCGCRPTRRGTALSTSGASYQRHKSWRLS